MELKKLNAIHLQAGLKAYNADSTDLILLTASYLADTETLLNYRTDPKAITPFLHQVAEMELEEVQEISNFFTEKLRGFAKTCGLPFGQQEEGLLQLLKLAEMAKLVPEEEK